MEGKVSGMGALATALALALVYFYSMYSFSMLTGHITAMVAAFLALAIAAGAPPMLMVALLAYFSNLCGCLTNYSTGPVVIYSGFGYVSVAKWFKIGFIVSLFHLVVWLGVGLPYWKLLGWW
jgi:DASS family divalent anion:Na+ symporter